MVLGIKKIAIQQLNNAMFTIREKYFMPAQASWEKNVDIKLTKEEVLAKFYAKKWYHTQGNEAWGGKAAPSAYKPYHELFPEEDQGESDDENVQECQLDAMAQKCDETVSVKYRQLKKSPIVPDTTSNQLGNSCS